MSACDLYQLNKSIEILERSQTFLLNAFFNEVQEPQGRKITVDIKRRPNRLAPFVSPCVEGVPVSSTGFETVSLDPAYIRLKDAPSQCGGSRRRFGQSFTTDLSAEARLMMDKMDVYEQQENAIQQRMEWMAAQALFNGGYNVQSDHHPVYNVDFQRSPDNTVTLATPWSTGGVYDPAATVREDINALADLAFQKSRRVATDLVMDVAAWNAMSAHHDVNDLYQKFVGVRAEEVPVITPQSAETVLYKGMYGTFRIWVYSSVYEVEDEAGNITVEPMIPYGTIAVVAGAGLMGFQAYGEICHDDAVEMGLARRTRFASEWTDKNVGKMFVQTETAPLVIPGNPDAVAVAKVALP